MHVEPGDARLLQKAEVHRVVHVAKRVHVAPAHLHALDMHQLGRLRNRGVRASRVVSVQSCRPHETVYHLDGPILARIRTPPAADRSGCLPHRSARAARQTWSDRCAESGCPFEREQTVVAERESMEYDVVIVGAGPSGLAAAIRLKQLAPQRGAEISVCVLEKGSEVGAHILSGAVLEPRALERAASRTGRRKGAPLNTPRGEDRFLFLTATRRHPAADAAADAQQRQLHRQPGQSLPLAGPAGRGAGRGDLSRLRRRRGPVRRRRPRERCGHRRHRASAATASARTRYQPGMELHAKQTLFAEGCRGSLDQDAASTASTCAKAPTRRPTASASRSCGKSNRRSTSPG